MRSQFLLFKPPVCGILLQYDIMLQLTTWFFRLNLHMYAIFKFCLLTFFSLLVISLFNSNVDTIFILPLYRLYPAFSWNFPFYIIALWVMVLLFLLIFPEFILLKKPYSFWQQCQILSDKCLTKCHWFSYNCFEASKKLCQTTDYLLLFFPMISLVPNSMVELTWYWLNQWTNKSASSSFSWYQSSINWIKFPKKQKSTFLH